MLNCFSILEFAGVGINTTSDAPKMEAHAIGVVGVTGRIKEVFFLAYYQSLTSLRRHPLLVDR